LTAVEIPRPSGRPPYRLALADVLPGAELDLIERAGLLRFHCVGDTGGYQNPIPQRAVAAAMTSQLSGETRASFFYHLGDIVYLHGERANYGSQFFDPYSGYGAPILGVAGNHDGESASGSSLEGFAEQFCAPGSSATSATSSRPAQHQPNVYWTLEHDWVTIVGLYTGVAEGGQLDDFQLEWLTDELQAARRGVTLILAMHHPVFSADSAHGSNLTLRDALDDCFSRAGRTPDVVLGAHAHNYQRFTRVQHGRRIPYVVAGTGGFPELHGLGYGIPAPPASFTALPDLTLEAHQHAAFGFLTVSAGPGGAQVDYNTVVRRRPVPYDSFRATPVT
jgi:acid phosphatase type 7